MGCDLDIRLGAGRRDGVLEADLQARLDEGHRIFAIGDIHGHLETLRELMVKLNLGPEDRVVCLGDVIDRGPDSARTVEYIRSHPQMHCILGNHEAMAMMSLTDSGRIEIWQDWIARGGKAGWGSYIIAENGDLVLAKARLADDIQWFDTLPNHIVLDNIRLVHAGYDPRMALDSQGDKELLWVRKRWFNHQGIVDPERVVVFGHSTTTKVGGQAGEVAFSELNLNDGRPSWIAMDVGAYNHVDPGLAALDLSTLNVIRQSTLIAERWFSEGVRKEARAGECFGLTLLRERAAKAGRLSESGHRIIRISQSETKTGPQSLRVIKARAEPMNA